jgi:hypothetical protein
MGTPIACHFCKSVPPVVEITVNYHSPRRNGAQTVFRAQCICGAHGKCRPDRESAIEAWNEPWQAKPPLRAPTIIAAADPKRLALAAGHAASGAVTELLRFAREGARCNRAFDPLEGDPIAELADALALSIEIEDPFLAERPCYAEERAQAGQLLAALRKWQSDAGAAAHLAEDLPA